MPYALLGSTLSNSLDIWFWDWASSILVPPAWRGCSVCDWASSILVAFIVHSTKKRIWGISCSTKSAAAVAQFYFLLSWSCVELRRSQACGTMWKLTWSVQAWIPRIHALNAIRCCCTVYVAPWNTGRHCCYRCFILYFMKGLGDTARTTLSGRQSARISYIILYYDYIYEYCIVLWSFFFIQTDLKIPYGNNFSFWLDAVEFYIDMVHWHGTLTTQYVC